VQRQSERVFLVQVEGNLLLDDRSLHDPADRGEVFLHLVPGVRPDREATRADRPLAHGIHLPVGTFERGHQQGASLKRLGVADGVHQGIETAAHAGERRQIRGHHHGGDVLDLDVLRLDGDPHFLEHRGNGLHCEDGAVAVAAAGQANHQTVTDQLVGTHAAKAGDVLDAGGVKLRRQRQEHRCEDRESAHY